jgi:hypothetical protein
MTASLDPYRCRDCGELLDAHGSCPDCSDDDDESCTDLEERLDRAFNRAEHLKDCEDGK